MALLTVRVPDPVDAGSTEPEPTPQPTGPTLTLRTRRTQQPADEACEVRRRPPGPNRPCPWKSISTVIVSGSAPKFSRWRQFLHLPPD